MLNITNDTHEYINDFISKCKEQDLRKRLKILFANLTVSYVSKQGDPITNNNGKTKNNDGGNVECRHLAFEQLKHDKDYYTKFEN